VFLGGPEMQAIRWHLLCGPVPRRESAGLYYSSPTGSNPDATARAMSTSIPGNALDCRGRKSVLRQQARRRLLGALHSKPAPSPLGQFRAETPWYPQGIRKSDAAARCWRIMHIERSVLGLQFKPETIGSWTRLDGRTR
jgi:hypothetical protein